MIAVLTSLVLFAVGIFGVLVKRDILRILISVSIMLGSITLLLVALAKGNPSYAFVLFIWVVEIMEILVALSVFIYLSRSDKKDINELQELRW